MTNPLKDLSALGTSVWYDNISRSLIDSGRLRRMVEEDGLAGVTSNPAIFEKAIAGGAEYDARVRDLVASRSLDAMGLYETLALADIQDAADVLRPVFDRTRGVDGYVSLEVSPYLAHDTQATVEEARRLWKAAARPNVMIKVPGTPAGVPAIRQLIADGINVNVTLLFSVAAYESVAEAYLAGLEQRSSSGQPVSGIASVASFFVSRIDSLVDSQLAKSQDASARELAGKAAIANAKIAYQSYVQLSQSARWKALAGKGAMPQRLLWASTSTKNPAYRDVIYVEELGGADTVNTMPGATFDAFKDHGRARPSLLENVEEARTVMAQLARHGVDFDAVTRQLLDDAVRLFADPFDALLASLERKRAAVLGPRMASMSRALPAELEKDVEATLEEWRRKGNVRRLWARDASLWTGGDEARWLGWLDVVDRQLEQAETFRTLAREVRERGFTHALLLGMGGSSLAPEVLGLTFGSASGFPELHVLDSTDPAQVAAVEAKLDLARTLVFVSSKSGSTLEPNVFKQHFFERMKAAVGPEEAGRRFVAITDPGSKMEQVAKDDRFWKILAGEPSIGGRYSALSMFGMAPAAAIGLDVPAFLECARHLRHACGPASPPATNPGVQLGVVLGCAARAGRDKLTLVASPRLAPLGAWLEQLVAESTGKQGRGLIPVDGEALAPPASYGRDRVFVFTRLADEVDAAQDAAMAALEKAGHPVVRLELADAWQLGQEWFRWELATAVAGAVLGIHPFDQPDVEASKLATRALTSEYERTGELPAEEPALVDGGVRLFTDARNAAELRKLAGADQTLAGWLRAHVSRLGEGDYFGVLGYVERNAAHEAALQSVRHAVRDAKRVATVLGFGPRFLHSTGQAYKGGPDSGVFLQVTCDDAKDVPVPGQSYTFGVVKAAQARGDFDVLAERGRRALRVHLPADLGGGLARLGAAMTEALRG